MRRGIVEAHNISENAVIGQRQTRQRDAILRVISEADGPLSVPEIHERAKVAHAGTGIATIYRTLKLLQESAQIHAVILPSGESRFEPIGRGHHEHFQCRKCGSVFDIHACPLDLPRNTTLQGGFIVEDHELTLYGTCPGCAP